MSEVYTPFEQRIVDGYLKATYPDEPVAEPAPEPMQVVQAPAQTMTDVPADSGSIREIPRNMFQQALGKFGEALTAAGVQLDKVGLDIPMLGRVTLKDLTVGEAGKVIEDMSYGFMPTRGAGGIGGTAGLKPEAAELLNLPIVGTAAKAAGKTALGLGKATAQAGAAIGRELAPKAGEMAEDLLRKQGLLLPAVPLNRYGQVTAASAAKADQGSVRLSDKVEPGKNLQLDPQYRVKVVGSYTPEGKDQNITNAINPGNYQDIATRLDDLATAFPDPLKSNESFATMLANVYNSTEVPIPPRWLIDNVNDMPKWSKWFGSMTKGQIDEAARGFAVVDKFRNGYQSGAAGADTTGTLMFWAMLSRKASAYPHESGFLDLAEAMQPMIQKAVRGEYTQADIDAGLQMIKQTIPAGSPGKMVTSNANDFVNTFLPKMGEKLPDGRTKLQALHDMIANPQMTGPQIRREFYGLAEGVGIKNKVLSFALLVSGRDDVMVLDRIQINRLFAGGDKIYDDVDHLFDGGPGLAMYEGLERSLASRINELYASVGRPEQASIGRYHWESWVLSSGQEVAHPTLETIVKKAEGAAQPFVNVPVKEGRMHEMAFGVTYERMPNGGNRFVYETANGNRIAMTKDDLDEMFNHVKNKNNGLIPDDFPGVKFFSKDTLPDGKPNPYFGRPWYTWPGVNRELIDDFADAIGTPLPAAGSAGAVSRTVQGGAADGSKRAGRQTGAGQQSGVTRGGRAPQSGAQ